MTDGRARRGRLGASFDDTTSRPPTPTCSMDPTDKNRRVHKLVQFLSIAEARREQGYLPLAPGGDRWSR